MFENILMTEKSRNLLSRYLQSDKDTCLSLILSGEKGIGKRLIAESVARWLLNLPETIPLESSGNFFCIEEKKDQNFRSQMEELRELAGIAANNAARRVFLIDDAEKVNQHMLLKLLEDQNEYCVFILVAHKDLLPTIESRCFKIPIDTPSTDLMAEYLADHGEEVDKLLLACCNGRPGYYEKFITGGSLLERARKFLDKINDMERKREILEVCGAVKEKDESYIFTALDDDEKIGFFHFLQNIFRANLLALQSSEMELPVTLRKDFARFYDQAQSIKLLNSLDAHLALLTDRKGAYSKNDFFDLLILFME